MHDLLSQRHLALKVWVVGLEAQGTVGRLGLIQSVALLHTQTGFRPLVQDDPSALSTVVTLNVCMIKPAR